MVTSSLASPAVKAAPARKHRWWIPLLMVALAAVTLPLPALWNRMDLDPRPQFSLQMAGQVSIMLGIVVTSLWWLLGSGFAWRTRLAGVVVVALLASGAVAAIKRVEFSGGMTPIAVAFRWQPEADEVLEKHRAATGRQEGLPAIDLTVAPADFPRYRGRDADGVAHGPALADWTAKPPRLLWKQPSGGGHAGFAVAGNVAVTIEQRRDNEVVACYDRATGAERWTYVYAARFHQTEPMGGEGPRATPTIADGDVFSLGATGHLACLDGATGKSRWTVNILEDNGAANIDWGLSGSPLVVNGKVYVNAGINPANNAGKAVAAYDRATGHKVWAAGDQPAGYSSPQWAVLAGRPQILLFDGGGLASFDPQGGPALWRHGWSTFSNMNIIQPVVIGEDRVFISSESSNGGALLRVHRQDGGLTLDEKPLWHNWKLCARYASPVVHDGHLYGLSNGSLVCLDVETGNRTWRGGRFGNGQVLLAGTKLVVSGEFGDVTLVAADPAAFRELGRLDVFGGKRTWNTPALAGNQLFLRNDTEMACYELATE
jgi:outer membrane protein assembly factor BamB